MDRRRYLSVACVPLVVAAGGCSGEGEDPISRGTGEGAEGGTGTGGETGEGTSDSPESPTDEAPDVTENIWIYVRNTASEGVTVRLAVSTDGSAFFEAEVGVPANRSRAVDPGIDEADEYELDVAVEDGPDGSYPFHVERYALEHGSNLIVVVDDDDVRILIEE